MYLTPVSATIDSRAEHASLLASVAGSTVELDASDVDELAVNALHPVRTSPSWKGKRNYSGYYWAATTRRHHWFESLFERSALMALDRDPATHQIATQPITIAWATGRRHTPDICVRRADKELLLVDVRPRERIDAHTAETFEWTSALCQRIGVEYRLFADLTPTEAANLRFLSGFRHSRWQLTSRAAAFLVASIGQVKPIAEWAVALRGDGAPGLGMAYAALWGGDLGVDLARPLDLRHLAVSQARSTS